MNDPLAALKRLQHLGSIIVTGAAARDFLQGQLSLDMSRLTRRRMELASCNSSQGRVQGLLWMIERSDAIVLVLPASMVDASLTCLRVHVLRSDVEVDSGAGWFEVTVAV